MTQESIQIVSGYLAKQARLLARACAPEDRATAMAFAEALRKEPDRIIAGIQVDATEHKPAA
jgi:hypothetical protein